MNKEVNPYNTDIFQKTVKTDTKTSKHVVLCLPAHYLDSDNMHEQVYNLRVKPSVVLPW